MTFVLQNNPFPRKELGCILNSKLEDQLIYCKHLEALGTWTEFLEIRVTSTCRLTWVLGEWDWCGFAFGSSDLYLIEQ